jgi:hypothetical protein
MLFTSQKMTSYAQSASSDASVAIAAVISSPATGYPVSETCPVGTRTMDEDGYACSVNAPSMATEQQRWKFLTQINSNMKDARKQITAIAAHPTPGTPSVKLHHDDDLNLDNDVFSKAPAPRQPESPEQETLRSFLKHQLPRYKASQALSNKIRSSLPLQEHQKI